MTINAMLVFGTRPEAIKMAPLYHALAANPTFDVQTCVTAQHRQMLDQVLELFAIKPEFDLDLMREKQDLFDVTASALLGMRAVLERSRPDVLLVHGDTTTTLAASMAAFYAQVKVGHVEAGLRTYDLQAPFPEEFNRQVVSKLATLHFAPTNTSRENLLNESVPASSIFVTGNTVIDALEWTLNRIEADGERRASLIATLNAQLPFAWRDAKFVLMTAHRRENFGEGFIQIYRAIRVLAERFPTTHIVYPVHLNPNVQGPVRGSLNGLPNVHLLEPLGYEAFSYLLKHCHLVLTDSGGVQEEAPSLGKPVVVMRDVTERPDAVTAGTVRLVGTQAEAVINSVAELLSDRSSYLKMSHAHNPYGDGHACARIVEALAGFHSAGEG
jgi:UDP-N-acetylglucosamine 2-epimerase (non-hydrolysing)